MCVFVYASLPACLCMCACLCVLVHVRVYVLCILFRLQAFTVYIRMNINLEQIFISNDALLSGSVDCWIEYVQ